MSDGRPTHAWRRDMPEAADTALIRRCYDLARAAAAAGNHPFGALLAVDGAVVLEAGNTVNTDSDCTAHAEVNLVRQAQATLDASTLRQSCLYASTEPCAMCAGAIYWCGIPTVVYGCSAATLGTVTGGSLVIACGDIFARGRRHVQVRGPVAETEGLAIHRAFWR